MRNNVSTSKYPDYTSKLLRKQISSKFNCDINKVICGSGSDEIIQMLCQLFLSKGDQVIVPQFSFLMYRIYASISGAKVIYSKEKNFTISIDNIINKTASTSVDETAHVIDDVAEAVQKTTLDKVTPKNTVKAYKLFKVKDKKLFPLFVKMKGNKDGIN